MNRLRFLLAAGGHRAKVGVAGLALSVAGVTGLMQDEGVVNRVYLDPVGIPTACAGHTATVTRKDVGKHMPDHICEELLRYDVRHAEAGVRRAVKVPVTQGQFDSLTRLAFNVGNGALAGSTLVRKLNAGDCHGAAREFDKWVYAKGKKLPGLVNRRAEERAIFEADC